jgi:probable phosphoglycerate mutase
LTNHGVLQAKRLGSHLASRRDDIGPITHVFASNLRRAYTTAEAVAEAQRTVASDSDTAGPDLKVVQLPELREKDFGSREGVKFRKTERSSGTVRSESKDAVSDGESREAMTVRANQFIDAHIIPILKEHVSEKTSVAIVAHGIILGVLLSALIARFPAQDFPLSAQSHMQWSNTGVFQATIVRRPGIVEYSISVQFTNNVDHLDGLRKTRGGIGSARYDSQQRTLTSFFTTNTKKRKAGDEG